jgi:uncharacterized protein (DUF1697 family)
MTQYIAFLRAINVGGHTVKMADLRQIFEVLDFADDISTYIQTGNVIFESELPAARLEGLIEDHLEQALGYRVATFIRTLPEVAQIAEYEPFPADDLATCRLYIGFLRDQPAAGLQHAVQAFNNDVDEFHFHQREVYWLCRTSQGQSDFSGAVLEKTLKGEATLRNVTTVRKITAKYG